MKTGNGDDIVMADHDRILSDPALQPSAPYLADGRSVIGSDYDLELPIGRALKECRTKMPEGMDADAAGYLSELLYGSAVDRGIPGKRRATAGFCQRKPHFA